MSYAKRILGTCALAFAMTFNTHAGELAPLKTYSDTQFMQLLDFSIWNGLLENMVVYGGPPDREFAGKPTPLTGTRIKWGHRSAYRREGNKIPFNYMPDATKTALTLHREELIAYINDVELTRLSKNEWLAVWFNLHNAVLAEELARNYPVQTPREFIPPVQIDGSKRTLHDAKLITLKGQTLSLRDIRENIVYSTVKDPNVIYGFWLGDIGSPSLPNGAFEAGYLNGMLSDNAYEFVNGRRGYNRRRNRQNVSQIYADTAPYFFPNFEADLSAHLKTHFTEKLIHQHAKGGPMLPERYHDTISDFAGGQKPRIHSGNVTVDGNHPGDHSVNMLLQELERKAAKRQGKTTGTVIIEDIQTDENN